MARSSVFSRSIIVQKYYWPDLQLNIWTLVMLATGGTILGVFANLMAVQSAMQLGTPWVMPYGVCVGSLAIGFVAVELVLIMQRRLLPGVMILGSLVLFVLMLAGVIATAIQMFGAGAVNTNCRQYVYDNPAKGPTLDTLAWLQQKNICDSWSAAFAFWIIGDVFLVWMIIMAFQVSGNSYDD